MSAYIVFMRTKTIDQKELDKYRAGIKATMKGHPRRPASDQPDPALAESKRSGRWGDPRERGRHPTRWFDQRNAE